MIQTNNSAIDQDMNLSESSASFSFKTPSKNDALELPKLKLDGFSAQSNLSIEARLENSAESSEPFVWEPSFVLDSSRELSLSPNKKKPDY
jgi:hypothetical protein